MPYKVDRIGKDSRDVYSQKVLSSVVAASEDHCESENTHDTKGFVSTFTTTNEANVRARPLGGRRVAENLLARGCTPRFLHHSEFLIRARFPPNSPARLRIQTRPATQSGNCR